MQLIVYYAFSLQNNFQHGSPQNVV